MKLTDNYNNYIFKLIQSLITLSYSSKQPGPEISHSLKFCFHVIKCLYHYKMRLFLKSPSSCYSKILSSCFVNNSTQKC